MESNGNSSIKAAIILGVFILLAVCIGGFFLLANTAFERILTEIASPRRQVMSRSSCLVTEQLELPFSKGVNGVTSTNSYSGPVQITVAGKGQAAGSAYTDAFYIFTDDKGSSIPPEHPDEWILTINSEFAYYLIQDEQIPPYNDEHFYTFEIEAPKGLLIFGIMDGYAADNSGSFSISVCQH
jgi:hypothetical protein